LSLVPAKYKIQINQRYTNPGRQFAPPVRVILVSPQYGACCMLPTLPANVRLRWVIGFWKMCAPLS